MPMITNLTLEGIQDGETTTLLSRIIKALELKIVTLAVKGYMDDDSDIISALSLANPTNIKLSKLKHLTIDLVQFDALSLRTLIQNCERLESLYVDCQGTGAYLPLFYIIGLVRNACGSGYRVEDADLLELEQWQESGSRELQWEFQGESCGIIEFFTCVFSPSSTESGPTKVPEHLTLRFVTGESLDEPFNMNLTELTKFLSSGENAVMLSSLKTITLDTYGFEPEKKVPEDERNVRCICMNFLTCFIDLFCYSRKLPRYFGSTSRLLKTSISTGVKLKAKERLCVKSIMNLNRLIPSKGGETNDQSMPMYSHVLYNNRLQQTGHVLDNPLSR